MLSIPVDFEMGCPRTLERESVLSSSLFPLWLFENLFHLIAPDLILKLNLLKIRMNIPSFKNYK